MAASKDSSRILFIEPFYTGSHQQLITTLRSKFQNSLLITLPGKKWHWRARCSALQILPLLPERMSNECVLFTSSVLSLAELIGMRPDLAAMRKIVYFHENQLVYPTQIIKSRDVQYAYNQITTCLAADEVVFNSHFNFDSFMRNIHRVIKLMPDARPTNIGERIVRKCSVLYFPIEYPKMQRRISANHCLTIVWPHRWEHDKAPNDFIDILLHLAEIDCEFKVHILGEQPVLEPPDLLAARHHRALASHIETFGFIASKSRYYELLLASDVVVSTAIHEFFGVAMLEATYCGCFPLVPDRLVYPEIYPPECRYKDANECFKKLKNYSENPQQAFEDRERMEISFEKYSLESLLPLYEQLLANKRSA